MEGGNHEGEQNSFVQACLCRVLYSRVKSRGFSRSRCTFYSIPPGLPVFPTPSDFLPHAADRSS